MNTQTYEQSRTTKGTLRKKLFILSMLVAGLFIANSAFSQVRVEAHVGIGVPPPPVVVYERDYPGYTYYTYPAWRGHYRDRIYYTHYRPYFEREHRPYFNGRRFDHERFERENHWRDGRGHDRGNHRGHDDRRDDHDHRH